MDTEEALNPNKFWACLMQKVFTRVKWYVANLPI
jgi:hypothetical protein